MNLLRRLPLKPGLGTNRINRAPSPLLARGIPWLTVIIGSIVPGWLIISSAPVFPPIGFLMLVAWVQLRPGLLPVWAGLPLGLVEDLFGGLPFGTSMLLWSTAVIVLDIVEVRLPWRNFLMEWLLAGAMIVAYILLCLACSNVGDGATPVAVVVPQIVLAILAYPLVGRMIAALDRFRLLPLMDVG